MLTTEFAPLIAEQRAIVDLCRTFGADEIRPVTGDADTETLWRKAAEAGITSFMLPREYGGGGFTDILTRCLVQEELSAADATIANLLTSSGFFAGPVLELGTPEQKERWLRPLTSENPPMTALADLDGSEATVTAKARRVGGGYKLTGGKSWITNGGVADYYIFFATIEASLRAKGVTAFLVRKGCPGVTFGDPVRDGATVSTEVSLNEVFVPDANRLGGEGQGFCGLARTLDVSRTVLAASAVGTARACLEMAAGARHAEMTERIEASRQLVLASATILDEGGDATETAALAQQHASETAAFCA